jgi:CheY-like chemotaxis protein/curved DNA-binding protein CbpA
VPKVLIAIHQRGDLRRFSGQFERLGYTVVQAVDGMRAYDLFLSEQPDAVLINVLIPKLSGGELCRRIKEHESGADLPVVLLSDLFKKTDMGSRALDHWKADSYYQAPFNVAQIASDVDQLVEGVAPSEPSEQPATETPPKPKRTAGDLEGRLEKMIAEVTGSAMVDRSPKMAHINEEMASREPAGENPLDDLLAELQEAVDARLAPAAARPAPKEPPAPRPRRAAAPAGEDDDFDYEGDLTDTNIAEIFAQLFYARKTGILEVSASGVLKNVYFDHGNAVFVESESRQESLGQILVRQGIINEDDLMLSLENMVTFGKRQGGTLVEMGMITPMQLFQALRGQMREKLLSLFPWFEGSYFFDPTEFDRNSLTVFELPMPRVIYDGILAAYDGETIREMFAEVQDQVIFPARPLPFSEAVDMGADLWSVFDLIDGNRTVGEVVEASPLDVPATYLHLFAMLILRVFDREGETAPVEVEIEIETAPTPKRKRAAAPPPLAPVEPEPKDDDDDVFVFEDDLVEESEPAPVVEAKPDDDDEELEFTFEDDLDDDPLERELRSFAGNEGEGEPSTPAADAPDELLTDEELVAIDDEALPPALIDDSELAEAVMGVYLKLEAANHYELLGVEQDDKPLAIKLAYHGMVKKLHADKLQGRLSGDMLEKANQVVQAITAAYEVLSSEKNRVEYDRLLVGGGEELKERRITTILAAERSFNQGMLAIRRNMFNSAQEHFQEATDLFPEEGEYHAYLGWSQFNNPMIRDDRERAQLARESVERSLRINSKGDKGYYFLGKIMLSYGNKDKARQLFALAFRYNKNNEDARQELRRLQQDRERQRAKFKEDEKEGFGDLLGKDLDISGVKRAFKKLFK